MNLLSSFHSVSDLVFSEFAFLNKAHQTLPAAPPSVPSSSSSSSSSTGCSDKEEASPDRFSPPPRVIQEKVSRFFKPATARKPEEPTNLKKAEVEKNASLGPTNASVLHQSPHSPSSIASNAQPIGQKSSPRPRHSSPTWDIELGLDLPSDDESLRNIELAKRENRALDLNGKWSGPKDVEQSKVETTISGPPGDASSAPKPKTPSGPFPDRALSPISDGLSPSHVHIPPTRHTVDPPVRLTPAPSFRSLPPFNTAHEQVLYVVNETALVEIQNHPTIRPAASAFHTEPHPVDASSRVPLWLDHDHDHDHNSILPQSHHVLAPVATSLQSLIDACDAELQSRAFERRHRRRSKSHSTSKRRDVPCASRVDSVYVAADNDAWRCEVPDEMARQNQNGGPYWHLAHIPDYDCAGGDVEMDDCAFPAATGWYIDDENEHDEPVFEDQGLLFDEGGACEYSGEYDSRLASAFDGGAVSYDVLLEEERWQDSEEGNNSELDHGSFDPEGLLFPASCEAVAAQEDGGGYDVFNDGDVRFDMAGQSDVVDFPFYDDGLDDQRSMISSSIPDDSSSNLQLDQTHAVSKYPTVSSNDHDHFSYPAPLQPFSQGRALLLGIEPVIPSGPDLCLQPVGRDHWRRFKL
ncbi:hypothetical protein BOTBODRAFT_608824 [Botryobasidium botryosum FD-172 SS1]|uniref:Uncharacterized protein n=1 Tax=Botryobasidium botryosum (strain FD-172 SS1) TaxID=930990 RepID=A0A067M7C9_BOTB1|nr:hypothetical protein BOTBODRAFT_608824 [Botryobasidium botryosum FD-172 SS1]